MRCVVAGVVVLLLGCGDSGATASTTAGSGGGGMGGMSTSDGGGRRECLLRSRSREEIFGHEVVFEHDHVVGHQLRLPAVLVAIDNDSDDTFVVDKDKTRLISRDGKRAVAQLPGPRRASHVA